MRPFVGDAIGPAITSLRDKTREKNRGEILLLVYTIHRSQCAAHSGRDWVQFHSLQTAQAILPLILVILQNAYHDDFGKPRCCSRWSLDSDTYAFALQMAGWDIAHALGIGANGLAGNLCPGTIGIFDLCDKSIRSRLWKREQ
jgi:hypothetical protein